MKRVRYPFIIRFTDNAGKVLFAKEGKRIEDFQRVPDQLEATVYRNYRAFSKGYLMGASKYLAENHKRHQEFPGLYQLVESVYVGG